MTPKDMREHIVELAYEHHISILLGWIDPKRSYADADDQIAVVGMVENERTYAVALHEIGHLVSPDGHSDRHPVGIRQTSAALRTLQGQEIAAWAWAQEHARTWTDAMEEIKAIGLATYDEPIREMERQEQAITPCMKCGADAATVAVPMCETCRAEWTGEPELFDLMIESWKQLSAIIPSLAGSAPLRDALIEIGGDVLRKRKRNRDEAHLRARKRKRKEA